VLAEEVVPKSRKEVRKGKKVERRTGPVMPYGGKARRPRKRSTASPTPLPGSSTPGRSESPYTLPPVENEVPVPVPINLIGKLVPIESTFWSDPGLAPQDSVSNVAGPSVPCPRPFAPVSKPGIGWATPDSAWEKRLADVGVETQSEYWRQLGEEWYQEYEQGEQDMVEMVKEYLGVDEEHSSVAPSKYDPRIQ
jgi:hypothetical protein